MRRTVTATGSPSGSGTVIVIGTIRWSGGQSAAGASEAAAQTGGSLPAQRFWTVAAVPDSPLLQQGPMQQARAAKTTSARPVVSRVDRVSRISRSSPAGGAGWSGELTRLRLSTAVERSRHQPAPTPLPPAPARKTAG